MLVELNHLTLTFIFSVFAWDEISENWAAEGQLALGRAVHAILPLDASVLPLECLN